MRALMYHHFGPGRYGVEREEFRVHCRLMTEHQGAFTATFDDGMTDAFEAARDLEDAGQKGRFFITTSWVGRKGYMDRDQIRSLHDRGHVIGLHGHTHMFLRGLGVRLLREELRPGLDILGEVLGRGIEEASLPGGRFDDTALHVMADLGIKQAWTSEPGHWSGICGSLATHGRDLVPRGAGRDCLQGILDGHGDWRRSLRYQFKFIPKILLGDSLYHKMTSGMIPGNTSKTEA